MEPFVVPPRGEVRIECEATPKGPGPFNCPMFIAYYDGDYQGLRLSVTGTWLAPRVAGHGPTQSH